MHQPIAYDTANPLNFLDLLPKLKSVDGIFITQKKDLMEVVSGCERENKYTVFAADSDGNMIKNLPLFKCKEKSDCCSRILYPGDCRPFKMNTEHYAKGASSKDGDICMEFHREFSCTCLCLNRPEMEVRLTENG